MKLQSEAHIPQKEAGGDNPQSENKYCTTITIQVRVSRPRNQEAGHQ